MPASLCEVDITQRLRNCMQRATHTDHANTFLPRRRQLSARGLHSRRQGCLSSNVKLSRHLLCKKVQAQKLTCSMCEQKQEHSTPSVWIRHHHLNQLATSLRPLQLQANCLPVCRQFPRSNTPAHTTSAPLPADLQEHTQSCHTEGVRQSCFMRVC